MVKKVLFVSMIALLFLGCSEKPQEKLLGSWVVDYNETFKAIKNSDVWDELGEAEIEMFPDLLEEMIGGLRVTITDSELITEMGSERVLIPYEVISSTKDKVVTNTVVDGEKTEVTFTILTRNMIMFSSNSTNDMDYMIWKREAIQKV